MVLRPHQGLARPATLFAGGRGSEGPCSPGPVDFKSLPAPSAPIATSLTLKVDSTQDPAPRTAPSSLTPCSMVHPDAPIPTSSPALSFLRLHQTFPRGLALHASAFASSAAPFSRVGLSRRLQAPGLEISPLPLESRFVGPSSLFRLPPPYTIFLTIL